MFITPLRTMAVFANRILRYFIFSLGIFFVILGIIGAFLPIMPTTPFVLVASWCFMKSSPKTHRWLLNQPLLGPALRNWEQYKAIRRPVKIFTVSAITVSNIGMWFTVDILWLKITTTLILIGVVIFIVTRNEYIPPSIPSSTEPPKST